MLYQRYLPIVVLVFAVAFCSTGCKGKSKRGTVPAKVTVTYKGQPVEEAVVVFIADNNYANGATGKNGVAKMMTFEPDDGAIPDTYKVTISKAELIEELDPNKPGGENVISSKTVFHIPQKYGNVSSSGLTAMVTKEGPNEFQFDLE